MQYRHAYFVLTVLGGGVFVLLIGNSSYTQLARTIQSFDYNSRDVRANYRVVPGANILTIPNAETLREMNSTALLSLYHRYTNTYQILCRNQLRVGNVYGGKEVCIDEIIAPKKPCLVYSYGSNNAFSFESDVIRWFGCDVHTFDPSMGSLVDEAVRNPPGCTFHRTGLGEEDTVTAQNWTLKTLGTTMKELHHEKKSLDILKIDVEGGEWAALPQMIDSGVLFRTKQLQIEIHFRERPYVDMLLVLKQLFDVGFRLFNRERNTYCKVCSSVHQKLGHWVFYNIELCLINTRFLEDRKKQLLQTHQNGKLLPW